MSAEALARLENARWLAAERASKKVEAEIDRLHMAIDDAIDAWEIVKLPEARDEERDLRELTNHIMGARYGR